MFKYGYRQISIGLACCVCTADTQIIVYFINKLEKRRPVYSPKSIQREACVLGYCHVEVGFRPSSSFVPLAPLSSVDSFSMVDHCSECCSASSALISCNGLDLSNEPAW